MLLKKSLSGGFFHATRLQAMGKWMDSLEHLQ